MDYFNVNQSCHFCLQTSKTFKVKLSYFDENGKVCVNPMVMISDLSFQCEVCLQISTLDFKQFSNPDVILHLKNEAGKKQKMKDLLQKMIDILDN